MSMLSCQVPAEIDGHSRDGLESGSCQVPVEMDGESGSCQVPAEMDGHSLDRLESGSCPVPVEMDRELGSGQDALVEMDCECVEREREPTIDDLYNSMFKDNSDHVVKRGSHSISDDKLLSPGNQSCFHNAQLKVECDEMEGEADPCGSNSPPQSPHQSGVQEQSRNTKHPSPEAKVIRASPGEEMPYQRGQAVPSSGSKTAVLHSLLTCPLHQTCSIPAAGQTWRHSRGPGHKKTATSKATVPFQLPYKRKKAWQKVRVFQGCTETLPEFRKPKSQPWTFEEERALVEFVSYNRDLQTNPDAVWPMMKIGDINGYWAKCAAFIKGKASTPYLRAAGALRSHLNQIRNQHESFEAAEDTYGITPAGEDSVGGRKASKASKHDPTVPAHNHMATNTAGSTNLHIFPKGSNEALGYSANCLTVSKHAGERVHTGTITFQCDDCDERFSFSGGYVLTETHQKPEAASVNGDSNKPAPDSVTSRGSAIKKPHCCKSTSMDSAAIKSDKSLESTVNKRSCGASLGSAVNKCGNGTSLGSAVNRPGTSLGIEHKHECIEHRRNQAQCGHCDCAHAPISKPADLVPKERFECGQCKKVFLQRRFYDEHMKIHELEAHLKVTGTQEKVFKCEKCDYSAASFATMQNHHYKYHIGKERAPVICEQCGRSVANMESLRMHQLCVHSEVRAHQCNVCGKAFKVPGHLKNHMTIHSEDRPFKCDLCGLAFKRNDRMKRHRKNICLPKQSAGGDVTEGKFACVTCGKRFSLENTLEKHKLVHLRENPVVPLGPVTSP